MERPARVTGQPFLNLGVLVSAVVAEDDVDDFASGYVVFDLV
jgi:hypothetical protein